jgi:hypothetical protein
MLETAVQDIADKAGESPRRIREAIVFIAVALGLIAWCNPFIGGESSHVVSDSALSSSSYGEFSYGSKTVYARAGQTLSLSCDATVERGQLTIHIWREWVVPRQPHLRTIRIDASQQAKQYEIPIRETGLYRISISPWKEDHRYDITYDVSWRVH